MVGDGAVIRGPRLRVGMSRFAAVRPGTARSGQQFAVPDLSIAAAHSLTASAHPVAYCVVRYSRRRSIRVGHPLNLEAKDSLVAFTISAALCCRRFRGNPRSQPNSSLGIANSYIGRETRRRFSWRTEAPSNLGASIRLAIPSRPLFGIGAAGGFRPCYYRASAGGVALVHGGILLLRCTRRLTGAQRNAEAPFTT